MISRRKFLRALGIGTFVPGTVLSRQSENHPGLKRSRWELLFANPETVISKHKPDPGSWSDSTITAAWIGHATVLINFFGTKIITDPVFSERIGINVLGLTTVGPKRLVAPALSFEELPPIDLILLSHAHMDHLDLPTIQRFDSKIPIVMAKNTSDVIDGLSFRTVIEMDWGENQKVLDVAFEAVQVKHFGWRFPWEEDRSKGNWDGRSYNAYVISKNGKKIFFGGDTAYQEFFLELAKRKIEVDLAMMPIGAYDPWIRNHCNPEQAIRMAEFIQARHLMPIHWGTFIQSDEPTNEPIERFRKAIATSTSKLALDSHGQTWTFPQEDV
jgi:L-ascorbate metabolism protein UlaG (beta-lactamase superfamily)